MAVLSPAPAAVWMCPECGHGSPEPRDERAHLDAHRQLKAFFREWDAGTEQGQVATRSRRRLALVYAVVALLVMTMSVTVFSRINRGPGVSRPAPPTPSVVAPAAQPQPSTPAPATSAAAPKPRTMVPAPAATAPRAAAARDDVVRSAPAVSPGPTVPATTSTRPVPAPDGLVVPSLQPPAAPAHLVQVCVLGLCLTVL